MGALVFKSEAQILGDQITKVLSETAVNDLNPGSTLRVLLEADAQEIFNLYMQLVSVVRNYNLDTTTGADLDNRGAEYGVTRFPALKSTGVISILRPAGFVKVSTTLYTGFAAPSIGDTILRVNDASNTLYGTSGSLVVGRGTSNEETVTYSAAPTNQTNYWQFTTSAFTNNHGPDETVVLLQGTDQVIQAGTAVVVPPSGSTAQVQFNLNETVTLLAGEASVDNVDVTCSIAGSIGNIPIQAINGTSAFPSPPFAGAQAFNYAKYTTGQDLEIDDDYRNRIKNTIQSLSKATKLALLNAIVGLVDPTTAKRVVSANVVLPTTAGDPVKIYIDDGTGYEPPFASVGFEQPIDSAMGGETRLQLDFDALVKAQVQTAAAGPYDLSTDGLTLTYQVGLLSNTITFRVSDFAYPAAATAQEIAAKINSSGAMIEARTAKGGTQVVISAIADTNEDLQVTGGTANSVLQFPTQKVSTLMLYVNDQLQSKDGSTAYIQTGNAATYNFSSLGGTSWPLNVTVDGKSANPQVVTFTTGSFANPAQATAQEVATAINAQLAGALATVTSGNYVQLTSNYQLNAGSQLHVTGGAANTVLGFPTSSVVGSTSNYTLNRDQGTLQLAAPLPANATVTCGSKYTRAYRRCASPEFYSVSNGQTLVVSVDGGSAQTITFSALASASAQTVAAAINAGLQGATASVRTVGGQNYLEITTNSYAQGVGSIEVSSSSTATGLNFPTNTTVINQRPHKAFVAAQNAGPYAFTLGQTLVVVIDGNAATNTFTITFGFPGTVTAAASTTSFTAQALAQKFPNSTDLPGFWVVWQSGANTLTASNVATVTNVSGNTWQYAFAALPSGLSNMAAGDHVTLSGLINSGNNGSFIITAVSATGNGYIQVTNPSGVAESGSAGTALIGQRRAISTYANTTGGITLGAALSATPSIGDTFSLLPYSVNNVVTYLSNRKVSTLAATATVAGVNNNTQVQIASNSEGSDGIVQVTGGTANSVLGFSTTAVPGLAGYLHYTGLTEQVHKTVYGDATDLVSYPGVGAAGIDFQILAPTKKIVSFNVTLTLAQGVAVSNVQDQVKSAISGYVNSLGVGQELILASIVQKIMEIDNILDVQVTAPTANVTVASNEIARTADANITVG